MPRRDDINKILVLGSGPIVIGQAAEFDYSGVQACKVLLEEGYEVVLVNSNPATIMTDPEFATRTYIEPLLPGPVAKVIEREKPDALLPTLGGGTALNLARILTERGVLERNGVELLGADYDVIRRAEDRDLFKATMERAGLRVPRAAAVTSIAEAEKALPHIGLPAIVRPGFTMGGQGGGVAYNVSEYRERVAEGLAASPINQVLVEESVIGWGEFALEEIPNDITQATPASFEPTIDYVVVKWPRFAFEKFPGAEPHLTTQMRSVGEAMAIGRTFKQAFWKAMRSRELDVVPEPPADIDELLVRLETPSHDRYELVVAAIQRGVTEAEVCRRTLIDPWFVAEIAALARGEDPEAGLVRTFKPGNPCGAVSGPRAPNACRGWHAQSRESHTRADSQRPAI